MERKIQNKQVRLGATLIIAMIFVLIFASLSVCLVSFSGTNIQIANNQHKVNEAYNAAQSGFECAKRLAVTATNLGSTYSNIISATDADIAWANFCSYVADENLGGQTPTITTNEIVMPAMNFGSGNATFQIRFTRLNSLTIKAEVTGVNDEISRKISMNMEIGRNADILEYAIASRGRIWVTGDSTIHGGIYSSWNLSGSQLTQLSALKDQLNAKIAAGTLNSTSFSTLVSTLGLTTSQKTTVLNQLLNGTLDTSDAPKHCISFMPAPSISPLNMTSDSAVLGTISACWTLEQIASRSWQFESLDENGNPIDQEGNPLGTNYEDRFYGPYDEIQGYHEGINYGIPPDNLDGMNIADYDTTTYYNATRTANGGNGDIPYNPSAPAYYGNDASLASLPATCGTLYRNERFPHDASSYTTGSGIQFKRYIYKDQNFSNVRIPDNRNALFINCTFNNVLFVDCTNTTYTNNVRFDNCTFTGTIASDTPANFNWQKNCLYFTGEATFDNNPAYGDATILAPHFNVNLGNTNPEQSENNVLEGAIVGGIVDVRGNAQVLGTIISMADTSSYTSGYVTNIGATLGDGGSETTQPGDIGIIDITPAEGKKIPSGIKASLEIQPLMDTYSER